MMISDPNLVYYGCVAKGTTILAEFNTKDADLGPLALKCLEKTPPLHSVFTHTVRNRTYIFFIEDPFAYFGIFDENLENSEGLAFLKSVKDAFNEVVGSNSAKKRLQKLSSHCFQGEISPVFHHLLASVADLEGINSPMPGMKLSHGRNGSTDSSRGGTSGPVGRPLLGNAAMNLMKKKKRFLLGDCMGGSGGNARDASPDGGVAGLSREFTVVMHKNGLYSGELGQQKAKKVWKKHVWVVLSMDLIICTILFVVWLCICRGFKCVDA